MTTNDPYESAQIDAASTPTEADAAVGRSFLLLSQAIPRGLDDAHALDLLLQKDDGGHYRTDRVYAVSHAVEELPANGKPLVERGGEVVQFVGLHKGSPTSRSAQPNAACGLPLTVEGLVDTPGSESAGRANGREARANLPDASPLMAALICSGNGHLRDLADVADPRDPVVRTLRETVLVTPDGRLVSADRTQL